jgi:hypothetical protein
MDNTMLLVYVEFMRCVRRMEGQAAARKAGAHTRPLLGLT